MPTTSTDLRAECFVLCDFVQVVAAKLNILGGGWDRLDPPRLPSPASFYLAIKVAVPAARADRPLPVRIDLVDAAGERADPPPLDAQIELAPAPDAMPGADVPLLIPMRLDLTLDVAGAYVFLLRVDEEPLAQTTFRVTDPSGTGVAP